MTNNIDGKCIEFAYDYYSMFTKMSYYHKGVSIIITTMSDSIESDTYLAIIMQSSGII